MKRNIEEMFNELNIGTTGTTGTTKKQKITNVKSETELRETELSELFELSNIYTEDDETNFLQMKHKTINESNARYKRYLKNIHFTKENKHIKRLIRKYNNKTSLKKKMKLINRIDSSILKELKEH